MAEGGKEKNRVEKTCFCKHMYFLTPIFFSPRSFFIVYTQGWQGIKKKKKVKNILVFAINFFPHLIAFQPLWGGIRVGEQNRANDWRVKNWNRGRKRQKKGDVGKEKKKVGKSCFCKYIFSIPIVLLPVRERPKMGTWGRNRQIRAVLGGGGVPMQKEWKTPF